MLSGVLPLGLGRRMRNAARATRMIPMMTKTMPGLGKLVRLPEGLEETPMAGWMHDPRSVNREGTHTVPIPGTSGAGSNLLWIESPNM